MNGISEEEKKLLGHMVEMYKQMDPEDKSSYDLTLTVYTKMQEIKEAIKCTK